MNKIITISVLILIILLTVLGCSKKEIFTNEENIDTDNEDTNASKEKVEVLGKYRLPDEAGEHEGTWLQWPHNNTYGKGYKEELTPIWLEMTKKLSVGEKVHIVTYDEKEEKYVKELLTNVNMDKIDFNIFQTDDVWARDNGPIFVYDTNNELKIMDWGFNGWGEKVPYNKDRLLRRHVGEKLGIEVIDLNDVVIEGGAIELDGNGSLLLTRSAVVNPNRNPLLSEKEIEMYLEENYGVSNFIWLDGVKGMEITDFHIDGFAKFYNKSTLITLSKGDLLEWGVSKNDIEVLFNAKNKDGIKYKYIYLPLTKKNVILKNGKKLGYKGSYANFYIGNKVILVPNYNDPNDETANEIISSLYPNHKVVGIDVRELYKYGGMIHCVTQQQPIGISE
ncbi:agmatine deiminase family protein [Helicovermis profundi]|uniref:agmatine deiminase family protein n=1 Tax=Helicovermis profundi TaxID=3065157 RepID=UPI003BB1020E